MCVYIFVAPVYGVEVKLQLRVKESEISALLMHSGRGVIFTP